MEINMTLDEAKKIIQDAKASFSQKYEAAIEITNSPEVANEDILACLKHGGITAELGAIALYKRTGRLRQDDSALSIITSHGDWSNYLKELKSSSADSARQKQNLGSQPIDGK